ncbi:MAG: hypothetical protein ACXIVE_03475, partial [Salinarimonas sp.]
GKVMGGVSGPAVKPIILRMAYQCARSVAIPVIGCGGIMNAHDAIEYMLAGCSAVQVGTATFIHPSAMLDVIDGIKAWCAENDVARVRDIVGDLAEAGDEGARHWGADAGSAKPGAINWEGVA